MADTNCETNENIVNCTASGADYDGATFTLTLKIEIIQYDKYKEAWETSIDISDEKVTSLASFVTSKGVKYDGNESNTYQNDVYFLTDNTNNNVMFANYCWKIVRTTETGGVKLIYNGEPTDGKCNNSGEDTTIGKSAFNTNYNSPAYVGYMYNKVYEWKNEAPDTGSVYGKDVKYANGVYTLEDTSDSLDKDHHYTCNNETGTCEKVRYYYYNNYYIELNGTKNIESALKEMLSNDNVNKNDSTIKNVIDNWYKENMIDYEDYLEDTVFCNDRSIKSLGGWNPNGGSMTSSLLFKDNSVSSDLTCSNDIDKFTVSENIGNGILKYPVGLLSSSEANLWGSTTRNNSSYYWLGSPSSFNYNYASERIVNGSNLTDKYVNDINRGGVRPSISLEPNTVFTKGDGTTDSPFLVPTNPRTTAAQFLVSKANAKGVMYENGNKAEMFTFNHEATEQTEALTDYRYIGDNPNNFVKFNCDDNGENCENWRIVGVFTVDDGTGKTEKRIKLVRGSLLDQYKPWNDKDGEDSINEWSEASLNTYLNGTYYDGLSGSAQSMIDDAKYYLGGSEYNSVTGYGNSEQIYIWERGTKVLNESRTTNWIGKVGLLYPSGAAV